MNSCQIEMVKKADRTFECKIIGDFQPEDMQTMIFCFRQYYHMVYLEQIRAENKANLAQRIKRIEEERIILKKLEADKAKKDAILKKEKEETEVLEEIARREAVKAENQRNSLANVAKKDV